MSNIFEHVKVVVMDQLKEQYPEKFSGPSSAMDYKWFEADIRPNYNCFIRQDVKSIAFSFDVANCPLTYDQAAQSIPILFDVMNKKGNWTDILK